MLEPMSDADIRRLIPEGHDMLPFARAVEAARDAAWQPYADALVAQAVAQERERWRLLIDEGTPYGEKIAAAIRARTQGGGGHG